MYIWTPSHWRGNYWFVSFDITDTVLFSISWELCSKYTCVCLLIRMDVTFYLGKDTAVQMLRRTLVYWLRTEHLICT